MSARVDLAVTITGREAAELLPVERPSSPLGSQEVLGATRCSLISPGTELHAFYLGSRFPALPGYAAVFEVEEAGAEVTTCRPGDLAFCMGRHTSFQRAAEGSFLRVPEGLAPEVAVFARMMGISMSTLTTTTARPPARVVVTGLGLVGHLAAQIFQACGYEVLACEPDPVRRELASAAGLETVLPAVPLDDPVLSRDVALVLECSGHEQALLDGCRIVRKRGEVVCIGVPWKPRTDLTAHALHHAIFHHYVVLRSGWEWELPRHPEEFRENSIWGNFRAALQWLESGRIRVEGIWERRLPRECQPAYQDLLHQRSPKIALLFDWRQPGQFGEPPD